MDSHRAVSQGPVVSRQQVVVPKLLPPLGDGVPLSAGNVKTHRHRRWVHCDTYGTERPLSSSTTGSVGGSENEGPPPPQDGGWWVL